MDIADIRVTSIYYRGLAMHASLVSLKRYAVHDHEIQSISCKGPM